MADDPLLSARTKLHRANVHTRTTRREIKRFFDRHTETAFDTEPEGDQSLAVGSIFGGRLVLTSDIPNPPESFGARFGDAIQNYRSALDHVAWRLVPKTVRNSLSDRERNLIQFPIYSTREGFRGNHARRLPGISGTVRDYIEARHAYNGSHATNEALLSLARLSNDDKHRTLHVHIARFRTLQTNVTYTRCEPVTWENPPGPPPSLKKGTVVAHFSCRVLKPDPEMRMVIHPTVEVALEDRGEVTSLLEGIRREVTQILDAPEILAGIAEAHASPSKG